MAAGRCCAALRTRPACLSAQDYIELANAEQERQEEAQRPQQLALRQGEARAGGGAGGQDLGAGGQHGVQTATA